MSEIVNRVIIFLINRVILQRKFEVHDWTTGKGAPLVVGLRCLKLDGLLRDVSK